jgi:hypothetical protein
MPKLPGCNIRFTQGHHVKHWANGGETKLSNLLNLCYYHHHLVHDGGYGVELVGGEAAFYWPGGKLIPNVPPRPLLHEDPISALRQENEEDGLTLEGEEGKPKWGYERIDWGFVIDVPLGNIALRREKGELPPIH